MSRKKHEPIHLAAEVFRDFDVHEGKRVVIVLKQSNGGTQVSTFKVAVCGVDNPKYSARMKDMATVTCPRCRVEAAKRGLIDTNGRPRKVK